MAEFETALKDLLYRHMINKQYASIIFFNKNNLYIVSYIIFTDKEL